MTETVDHRALLAKYMQIVRAHESVTFVPFGSKRSLVGKDFLTDAEWQELRRVEHEIGGND